jgi:hypothetical protein
MSSPLLWGPNNIATNLESGLIQSGGSGPSLLSGAVDPTVTATTGAPSSLYQSTSTAGLYRKIDSGTTTNWVKLADPSSVTNTASYPVTITGCGTCSNIKAFKYQLGDRMYYTGSFTSGVATATTFAISLDSGETIDSTKVGADAVYKCGELDLAQGTISSGFPGSGLGPFVLMTYLGIANNYVYVSTSTSGGFYTTINGNALVASGYNVTFSFNVPLVGLTATVNPSLSYRSINSISTNTNAGALAATDYVYFVSGTTTLTLPTAVGNSNRYTVKNTGVATVTIGTTSSQTIDGSASATLSVANTSLDLISDGSNWRVV